MRKDVERFTATFRQLEQIERPDSREERHSWLELRQKLTLPPIEERADIHTFRKVIAVAGFYPQAGASFLAANFALYQAKREMATTLCEMPGEASYLYFALDFERRTPGRETKGRQQVPLYLQDGMLRVLIEPPLPDCSTSAPLEIANWFLTASKQATLCIIDLSSCWQNERAEAIIQWADEVWFVLDANLPSLTRTILLGERPAFWQTHRAKIKLIANKWNQKLEKARVIRQIEGTISLWEEAADHKIDALFPMLSPEKVSQAQLAGKLYGEVFWEEIELFARLSFSY